MIRMIIEQVMLTFRLVMDRRVPIWTKALVFLPFIYVLSPIDFLPDFILGLGQLDDIGIILLGMRLFESAVPESLVAEHRAALANGAGSRPLDVIDSVDYHIRRESDKTKGKRK